MRPIDLSRSALSLRDRFLQRTRFAAGAPLLRALSRLFFGRAVQLFSIWPCETPLTLSRTNSPGRKMLPQKSIQRLSFWKEPIMPRWPACGSTTPRRALLPYPKDDIGAATGMPDFLATALLNLVYVAHGNAWPTSRPKSAATMLRSMAASSAKGYLASPSAGLATVYSRRRQLSEARPGDEPSRTTASAAQFRATGIVSLVARSCKFQDLWPPSSTSRPYGWSGTGFRGRTGALAGCNFLP